MKPWIKRTLIAVTGATIVLGSLGACGHRGEYRHSGWSEERIAEMRGKAIERVSSQLELDAVQKQKLGVLADEMLATRKAALAGVRQTATYEAQAAIEFEALAGANAGTPYQFELAENGDSFDAAPVIQAIARDVRQGVPVAQIGAHFHQAVVSLMVELSLRVRQEEKLNTVALSGGVFQNVLLLQLATAQLRDAGFQVLTHRLTPPNDGGLALGQVLIANAQGE